MRRIIARLDFKDRYVIKGIQLEGLRKILPVHHLAQKYYEEGADEIVLIDSVASLFSQNIKLEIIKEITESCFIPIAIGGGINSLAHADSLFRAGADKIIINTASFNDSNLIMSIVDKYGSQAVVSQVQAKLFNNNWECMVENGRTRTGQKVERWIEKIQTSGVGEILVTNVDKDGTLLGLDFNLVQTLLPLCSVPFVISGGTKNIKEIIDLFSLTETHGVAIGAALHYEKFTIQDCRRELLENKISVRLG
jgi:cyclase